MRFDIVCESERQAVVRAAFARDQKSRAKLESSQNEVKRAPVSYSKPEHLGALAIQRLSHFHKKHLDATLVFLEKRRFVLDNACTTTRVCISEFTCMWCNMVKRDLPGVLMGAIRRTQVAYGIDVNMPTGI